MRMLQTDVKVAGFFFRESINRGITHKLRNQAKWNVDIDIISELFCCIGARLRPSFMVHILLAITL